MKRLLGGAVLALAGGVGTAHADVPIGLWQSPPDAAGVVLHVRTRACGGGAICGQVERVKDQRGFDTPSREVGRPVLLDLIPEADGSFAGEVWEPATNRKLRARMNVMGNEMQFNNCSGSDCKSEVWKRLR